MALKDRDRTARKPVIHGAPCSVGQLYRLNLDDPDELAAIHAVLYDEGLNAAEAFDELTDAGYAVSRQIINKHRSGKQCRCFRIDKDFCPTCKRHLDAHGDCKQAA